MSITPLENFLQRHQKYAPSLLRVGLGAVFLWSGLSKLIGSPSAIGVCTSKESAISFLEAWAWLPFDPSLMVAVQSYGEVIIGLLLIAGAYVRTVSIVCAALFILFFFIFDIQLIWKNFGLLAAALSLAMTGGGEGSLHHKTFINILFKRQSNQ